MIGAGAQKYGWRRRGVFVAYVQVADGEMLGLDGRCGRSFAMFGGGDVGVDVYMYACRRVCMCRCRCRCMHGVVMCILGILIMGHYRRV